MLQQDEPDDYVAELKEFHDKRYASFSQLVVECAGEIVFAFGWLNRPEGLGREKWRRAFGGQPFERSL
jgi:hypothetical protein